MEYRSVQWSFFLILALIVYAFAPAIVSILPILLGLAVIINSLFQLFFSMNTKAKSWSVYSSILLLIGGFVLLFNPFKSLMLLFQIFGFIFDFHGHPGDYQFHQNKKNDYTLIILVIKIDRIKTNNPKNLLDCWFFCEYIFLFFQ